MTSLADLDALDQAAVVRRGEASALDLVDAAIARIEALNPILNAVVWTRFEAAREEARRPIPDSPLAGVPFLLKDLGANQAGFPQSRGSHAFASAVSAADSELAARQRAAGLIVLGKSSTPEFGNTRRPSLCCSARRAIRGISIAPRVARPAGRRPRSRPAWFRSPTATTEPARSGSPPPPAGCSG